MDMEMSSGGVAGAVPPKLQEEDPAAAAAVAEPWPPARRCRVMLVAGVMALLLLAFFVLGQESASTVWEIASAKLTAMNNGRGGFMDDASRHGHGAAGNATEGKADELLGGLLAPGMDRRSCRSRYESWRYFKHFPYAPSRHLLRALRAYEARHRRCAPGTPLYAEAVEMLRSGRRGSAAAECRYVVWLPFDGLGNRMLSMASGFLYALLTGRVFLVALPPDSADLFCEPFPGTTWLLPHQDFPVANLFGLGVSPEASYTTLLNNKKIAAVVDDDDDTAASNATAAPAYVYLSLGWQLTDRLFFCGEHQRAIGKVSWLLLYSDLYFAPSLYAVTVEFRDELRRLFPEKEAASHLLLRYLLHPSNPVWGLVTRYYHSYLAPATRRIGVQIRMFGFGSIPVDDMYNQILACSRQERILPETDDGDGDAAAAAADTDTGGKTTAILIASLYADYYERLRARYYEHAAASGKSGGVWVGVFQPTHEERQATESLAHNQRALAEVYLLSFSEELLTSGMSTFGYVSSSLAGVRPTILLTAHGHKVPKPPCRRAASMEPCNLTPPRGVECRARPVDGDGEEDDLARHVRTCEDDGDGVKFFD
ncbi:hypothetical protein SEVIR_2G020400v4 [Setaria viridis]|uniref:Fucosyltransferase n=1 Tax=Setaria viridis TaxID=4556 RepID=A0A4V6Y8S4_SETVI|nr:probable fucosyltransferase 8 [Setaria viridis]TKW30206.1 hypothetical protein SEVIR_2G020400v2 [Setaria viridis]